jgi:hypothetical protein
MELALARPFSCPGEPLAGEVRLDLAKPTRAIGLRAELKGMESTVRMHAWDWMAMISAGLGGEDYEPPTQKRTFLLSGLDLTPRLRWRSLGLLPAGKQVVPFEFPLAPEVPVTFHSGGGEGAADIEYTLSATLMRPWIDWGASVTPVVSPPSPAFGRIPGIVCLPGEGRPGIEVRFDDPVPAPGARLRGWYSILNPSRSCVRGIRIALGRRTRWKTFGDRGGAMRPVYAYREKLFTRQPQVPGWFDLAVSKERSYPSVVRTASIEASWVLIVAIQASRAALFSFEVPVGPGPPKMARAGAGLPRAPGSRAKGTPR